MKSPSELAIKLRRQWNNATKRESRLIGGADAWPILESIGLPKPGLITSDIDAVKRHVDKWRSVRIGKVIWQDVSYRATDTPVSVPTQWQLHKPTEWISACADRVIRAEFDQLVQLAEGTDAIYHSVLIRRRAIWRDKPMAEVIQACRLASLLTPGCVNDKPLRSVSIAGIDTKFFERNSALVSQLLDVRYEGEVSRMGLEVFLGAHNEKGHWLLLMDLDGSLLPFRKSRVSSGELSAVNIPGSRVVIVENESCQHLLPQLDDTVAVLGSGFDLGWMVNPCLNNRSIAYWGDIDTWGLQCLSKARATQPQLKALMMSRSVFAQNQHAAVEEPVVAGSETPVQLCDDEEALYRELLISKRGRLEQEFLSAEFVKAAFNSWMQSTESS